MIKAIIFDFFGVINTTDPYDNWLNRNGLSRTGEFLEISRLCDTGKVSQDDFITKLSELSGLDKNSIKNEFNSDIKINLELVGLIKQLKYSYKIGMISNANGEFLRPILKENELEKLFDEIVISSEFGKKKPDEDIFEQILSRLNIGADESIFTDDLERYVNAAREFGMNTILFENFNDFKKSLYDLKIV